MRLPRLHAALVLAILALSLAPLPAMAQTTDTFTTDAAIGLNDASHEGHDIIVQGCTVTIDGLHAFHSLVVRNNATLTHTPAQPLGMQLTIATNATIEAGSKIDVSERGFGNWQGPGAGMSGSGGGYGGKGGDDPGAGIPYPGGKTYGSITQPIDLGSANGSNVGIYFASGGGAIHFVVGGTLLLNGSLSANGEDNPQAHGAASGGSIWLEANSFAGSGAMSANGGNGSAGYGSGGGGRIALYYDTKTFSGTSVAYGGTVPDPTYNYYGTAAGAGTIYEKSSSQPLGQLLIDNGGRNGGFTSVSESMLLSKVWVRGGGWLSPAPAHPLALHVSGDVIVEQGARLSADALSDRFGPGAPKTPGGGAGYGGVGGLAFQQGPVSDTYGSATEPTDLGSGSGGYPSAAFGGGAIRLAVEGTVQIDGRLSANGQGGGEPFGNNISGSGSGGGILISAGKLIGNGIISANGGSGIGVGASENAGAGGGGGRIALYLCHNSFSSASVKANGGDNGAPGSIYYGPISPDPTIRSLSLRAIPRLGPTFSLTVRGTKFNGLSVVKWNGQEMDTEVVSFQELRVIVPASSVAQVGTANITVFNPTDCGGTSAPVTFSVAPALYGDVDGNGVVDVADAVKACRVAAGFEGAFSLPNGDIAPYEDQSAKGYGDGRVDLADAVRLLRFLNGL